MNYEQTILINASQAKQIQDWLSDNPQYPLKEDDTFSETAIFPNGFEMDIKCCGSNDSPAWTEAVLFLNGSECCCTEPSDNYFGDWTIEYEGDTFTVHMINTEHQVAPKSEPDKDMPEESVKEPEKPQYNTNTKVSYMYRDSGNYKLFLEEVFRGTLPEDQLKAFNRKYAEQGFYPSQLQMRDSIIATADPEPDPDFHEFIRLITVQEHATVNKHINDFVEAFETKKVLAY
jgi:hypothetical protein